MRQAEIVFSVVSPEAISIRFNSATIANGSGTPVNIGLFSRSVPPASKLFVVRNEGEQRLDIRTLSVTGPLGKNYPGVTNVAAGGFTTFEIVPVTDTEGAFTGTVTLASSDAGQSPFIFEALYEVKNDADDDAVPDAWELAYFPSLTNVTTTSNSDGDAFLDKDEQIAGTDPTDEQDYFKVANCVMPSPGNGELVLVWDTVVDRLYRVHTTTNLVSTWSNVMERAGTGATTSYTNDLPSAGARFFKLDVRLQE
jgi:hypothetical protein